MPSILNSDDGVVSGTSGLKSTGGNDGITTFQQNGTERMRIDSSGNVGIGTSSPGTKFDVNGTITGRNGAKITGALASITATSTLFLEQDSSSSARILVAGADAGTSPTFSTVLINNASGVFGSTTLYESGLAVKSLGINGTTPSSSGAGITFPATQSASTDANTLDDYEEGTWSPTIAFGGNSVGVTYGVQKGNYTKVGNRVFASCYVQLSNKGSSTGGVTIGGLPFTAVNTTDQYNCTPIWANNLSSISGQLQAYVSPNSSSVNSIGYLGTGALADLTNTNCANNSDFMINVSYSV